MDGVREDESFLIFGIVSYEQQPHCGEFYVKRILFRGSVVWVIGRLFVLSYFGELLTNTFLAFRARAELALSNDIVHEIFSDGQHFNRPMPVSKLTASWADHLNLL